MLHSTKVDRMDSCTFWRLLRDRYPFLVHWRPGLVYHHDVHFVLSGGHNPEAHKCL